MEKDKLCSSPCIQCGETASGVELCRLAVENGAFNGAHGSDQSFEMEGRVTSMVEIPTMMQVPGAQRSGPNCPVLDVIRPVAQYNFFRVGDLARYSSCADHEAGHAYPPNQPLENDRLMWRPTRRRGQSLLL